MDCIRTVGYLKNCVIILRAQRTTSPGMEDKLVPAGEGVLNARMRVTHWLVPGDVRIPNQFASRFPMTSFPSLAHRIAFPTAHPFFTTHTHSGYQSSPCVFQTGLVSSHLRLGNRRTHIKRSTGQQIEHHTMSPRSCRPTDSSLITGGVSEFANQTPQSS